jgi:hypothetical protein
MSNRFANRKTLSLNGGNLQKLYLIHKSTHLFAFFYEDETVLFLLKYYKLKLKIVFLHYINTLSMKPTLKFAALFSFSLQGCEDMDDTAAPINLEVQDFIWKGLNQYYLWMYLTYLMIVLHHKMN